MTNIITLLLFPLDLSSELGNASELPNIFETAFVASGGMYDFWQRKAEWPWDSANSPTAFPAGSPFLHDAVSWIISKIVWSLTGTDGRLYVMFDDSGKSASAYGLDSCEEAWSRFTLKLTMPAEADNRWIWPTLLDVGLNGLAVGFSGKTMELERLLSAVSPVHPSKTQDEWPSVHRLLYQALVAEKTPFLLPEVPRLVMRPCGCEDMDALFLVHGISAPEAVEAIRTCLAGDAEVCTIDNHDAYRKWVQHGELPKLR
jgi:hypothetical protein